VSRESLISDKNVALSGAWFFAGTNTQGFSPDSEERFDPNVSE
jgi:hypothetical protein